MPRMIGGGVVIAAMLVGPAACALEEAEETGVAEQALEPVEDGVVVVYDENLRDGPQTNWFGAVHVTVNTATQYGGWVDGNGPDSYRAWARCNGSTTVRGVTRWAGDRRQSIATCSGGIRAGAANKGFDLLDNPIDD